MKLQASRRVLPIPDLWKYPPPSAAESAPDTYETVSKLTKGAEMSVRQISLPDWVLFFWFSDLNIQTHVSMSVSAATARTSHPSSSQQKHEPKPHLPCLIVVPPSKKEHVITAIPWFVHAHEYKSRSPPTCTRNPLVSTSLDRNQTSTRPHEVLKSDQLSPRLPQFPLKKTKSTKLFIREHLVGCHQSPNNTSWVGTIPSASK